jgi:hypothetical protein
MTKSSFARVPCQLAALRRAPDATPSAHHPETIFNALISRKLPMTAALQENLRLLDILENLPQETASPNPAQLAARLTDLCVHQGTTPTPEAVQQAVAVYLAQRATDQQLLDLIERQPQNTASASPAALRERLEALCEEQKVTASTQNIQRAIALFQEQSQPFTLWARPATEVARQAALTWYKKRDARPGNIRMILCGIAGVTIVLAAFAFLIAMVIDMNKYAGFIKTMFGTIFGAFAFATFGGAFTLFADSGLSSIPYRYQSWFQKNSDFAPYPLVFMPRLEVAKPDLARMQRWLSNSQAANALKCLSKSPVPITELDARRLDDLVKKTQDQQAAVQQTKDSQVWSEGLKSLRNSA